MSVLVKEVVLQLIGVPNPLSVGRESLPLEWQVGLLVKPHDDTHQKVR